eukprot:2702497-Lingulodinium_polyedra.AAC.1
MIVCRLLFRRAPGRVVAPLLVFQFLLATAGRKCMVGGTAGGGGGRRGDGLRGLGARPLTRGGGGAQRGQTVGRDGEAGFGFGLLGAGRLAQG